MKLYEAPTEEQKKALYTLVEDAIRACVTMGRPKLVNEAGCAEIERVVQKTFEEWLATLPYATLTVVLDPLTPEQHAVRIAPAMRIEKL